jgi:hypothetical protein
MLALPISDRGVGEAGQRGAHREMSRASVRGSSSLIIRICQWNNPLSGVVRGGCE